MKPFPKSLGACIDLAYKARGERLKFERSVEKKVEALKEEERKIADHILNNFERDDIAAAKGSLATATKTSVIHANVVDWDSLWKWISKTKSWDMLKKSVNDKAYRARLDANKKVPGVEKFVEVKLSLTKR